MAGHAALEIYQGDDWSRTVTLTAGGVPVDFAGYTARMQIRDKSDAVLVELTTANGKISIATVTITLALTDADTAALPAGTQEYDLFVTSPGGVDRAILEGPVDVIARVTR